jgi:hypothetical protein
VVVVVEHLLQRHREQVYLEVLVEVLMVVQP